MAKPRLTFVVWDTCPTTCLAADGLRQVYASTLPKIVKVDLTLYLDLIYEQIFIMVIWWVYDYFAKGKMLEERIKPALFRLLNSFCIYIIQ